MINKIRMEMHVARLHFVMSNSNMNDSLKIYYYLINVTVNYSLEFIASLKY